MKQETMDLMAKAERAIHSAENTMNDGDYDFAVSRVYYAMFYVASALLGEKDLYFRALPYLTGKNLTTKGTKYTKEGKGVNFIGVFPSCSSCPKPSA